MTTRIGVFVASANLMYVFMYGKRSLTSASVSYGFGMYVGDCSGFSFGKCYNLLITVIRVLIKCMTKLVKHY